MVAVHMQLLYKLDEVAILQLKSFMTHVGRNHERLGKNIMTEVIQPTITDNTFTEFFLYKTPTGSVKIEVFLRDETIWLTQARIAELFGVNWPAVTKHLQNIYSEGELDKNSTCSKMEHVQNEGSRPVTREIEFTPIGI